MIGFTGDHFRSSDDGEPSNSAGPPILGVIRSHELTNVMFAVVRYFGGVKLGVGGLIEAYRKALQMPWPMDTSWSASEPSVCALPLPTSTWGL